MKPFVAYYRVSTDRQGRSGLGLDAQQAAVAGYLAGRGELVAEFTEIESGRRADRPQLAAALAACRKHRAALVIAKLDRLARNVHFISGLMESGAEFVAVDIPEASPLTLHIMAAFAEHERKVASLRTREALAAAKKRGIKLGNPRAALAAPLAHQANRDQAGAFAAPLLPLIESLRQQGMSLAAIAEELNRRNIPTARRRQWKPQTVANAIMRTRHKSNM